MSWKNFHSSHTKVGYVSTHGFIWSECFWIKQRSWKLDIPLPFEVWLSAPIISRHQVGGGGGGGGAFPRTFNYACAKTKRKQNRHSAPRIKLFFMDGWIYFYQCLAIVSSVSWIYKMFILSWSPSDEIPFGAFKHQRMNVQNWMKRYTKWNKEYRYSVLGLFTKLGNVCGILSLIPCN